MVGKIPEKELKHHSRRLSIKEGMFAAASSSTGSRFVSPFAIAINASNSVVAMLSSVSGLLGPLIQVFSSRLIEKYPRKKIIRISVLMESLTWIPFIVIAFLFYKGILVAYLPFFLLLFYAIFTIASYAPGPAWFSWIGNITDQEFRGRWISKRRLLTGFASVIFALMASLLLNYFKKQNWTMFGFILLFALALIFRLVSWRIFKKQYEPKIKLKKGYYFSFGEFLKKSNKTNFGKFSIFRAALAFACSVSSPLLAVYLLRYLEFNYIIYIVVTLASSVFTAGVLRVWGNFSDKYGNYRVLAITSILIPIIPIVWILSPSPIYMILIPAFISGVSWAGFDLASTNFIYDNVKPQKRGLAVSYYNLLVGIGVFLGAGVGAILIKYLTISFAEPLFFIFLLGGVMRMIVVAVGIPKLREIKKTKKIRSEKMLKNAIFKQIRPSLHEEVHEIMSIKEYLQSK